MRETAELRVMEKQAWRLFTPDEGVRLGSGLIRKIAISTDDPRYPEIGRLERDLLQAGEGSFFLGWEIRRRYTSKELAAAELFHMWVSAIFEPAGEETHTLYDESEACSFCGAGRRQVGDLCLDVSRIPKRADLAKTISDEVVVSARLAAVLAAEGVTGVDFLPVRHRGKGRLVTPDWLQLRVTSPPVEVVEPTQYGLGPFDYDAKGEYRCPLGHTAGLNLISELHLERSTWRGEDFCATRQLVGVKRGLLRPRPSLLVSQRVYSLLKREKARGFKVDVAYLM
jgi:hypothetical protein